MLVHTTLPVAFSQIGQRSINQDTLYPAVGQANQQTQLFIVCDGMGGADKGEIASHLLCEAIAGYTSALDNPQLDAAHLRTALMLAYEAYEVYLKQHPLVSRMGSTLALLQFHQRGATVAHIGDSRVYQLRGGRIIFQTKDHKQVNDMVSAGVITATQALTHPWRHKLSRAVIVSSDNAETKSLKVPPDITFLNDIQVGDYFFICTDGVLEQLDEHTLQTLLAQSLPDQAKIQSILSLCADRTKDNYSGYLVGVQQIMQEKLAFTSTGY